MMNFRPTRSIASIFLMVALIFTLNSQTIPPVSAIPMVLESDIMTTGGGTNFTVAYTRESDTWSANTTNTFKLSIDVIEFGLDTISLNSVWFGYRFRNENVGFNYESWSNAIGRVSPLQPYWEDRVSLDPSKVNNTPSVIKMTIALKFVENFISVSDEEWSMQWSDVVTIILDPNASAIEITDPPMFYTDTITETVTETSVTTELDPNEWVAPYLQQYPHDMIIDINQTTGKAVQYEIQWIISGSGTTGNWGSVTLDGNPAWMIEGAWTSGVPIIIDGAGAGLDKGYHTYTLVASDERGFSIHHEVYVSVLNITGFANDNPEIVASLSNEYGGVPPQIAPLLLYPEILGIVGLVLIYKNVGTRFNN